MNTVHHASMRLTALLIDRRTAGHPYRVEQVDIVPAEDGKGAVAYCYLDDGDALILGFDLSGPFHEDGLRAAFLSPPATVH